MLERISSKFSDVARRMSGQHKISEKNVRDAVEEIKLALLEADVNVRVVRRFVNSTIEEASGEVVLKSVAPGQQFVKIVHDRMVALLGDERSHLELRGPDTLSVILLLGLQGSGKTTSAAKLAARLLKEGRKPLLVAADLVRPAAIDQLVLLGERVNVEVFHDKGASDPVKLAKAALAHAKRSAVFDTVIVDTSGRMELDDDLMREIERIKKTVDPVETLLVADSMTGQNAVEIAKAFDERVGLTGIVLTKFDSDARGGAALSLKTVTGKPIKFIGVGEKPEDFEPFHPDRIASRILGMGDVLSLVEKAQETIDESEALELQKKLQSATFTLEDYLEQFARLRKMGSLEKLAEMIPGLAGQLQGEEINEKEIRREEAIILSMTTRERQNHRILGPSRRKRVAKGSGTSVFEVNRLLKRFEKMRGMLKKASKNKQYQNKMLSQMQGH